MNQQSSKELCLETWAKANTSSSAAPIIFPRFLLLLSAFNAAARQRREWERAAESHKEGGCGFIRSEDWWWHPLKCMGWCWSTYIEGRFYWRIGKLVERERERDRVNVINKWWLWILGNQKNKKPMASMLQHHTCNTKRNQYRYAPEIIQPCKYAHTSFIHDQYPVGSCPTN